jgi:hypothetical protein
LKKALKRIALKGTYDVLMICEEGYFCIIKKVDMGNFMTRIYYSIYNEDGELMAEFKLHEQRNYSGFNEYNEIVYTHDGFKCFEIGSSNSYILHGIPFKTSVQKLEDKIYGLDVFYGTVLGAYFSIEGEYIGDFAYDTGEKKLDNAIVCSYNGSIDIAEDRIWEYKLYCDEKGKTEILNKQDKGITLADKITKDTGEAIVYKFVRANWRDFK